MVSRSRADLLLLDLMLPGIDGLEICRQLRVAPQTRSMPIIIVSASGEESEVALGLGLGTDDYVTKPFSPRELIARVQAVLRRANLGRAYMPGRVTLKDLVIDVGRHEVKQTIHPAVPAIMLTARDAQSDIVFGLGLGAEDYVTKPFSPRELVARVKAVLRRTVAPKRDEHPPPVRRRHVEVDPARHEVRVAGHGVELTATEFRLLQVLACHPGRVSSRDLLVERAIGEAGAVLGRTIDAHIRSIRKKLGPQRDLIETVRVFVQKKMHWFCEVRIEARLNPESGRFPPQRLAHGGEQFRRADARASSARGSGAG